MPRRWSWKRALAGLSVILAFASIANAQEPATRAEAIQLERRKKAAQLSPELTSGTETALVAFRERRILEKFTYGIGGLRARIGALVTGSGFAIGPEYFRDDLADGKVLFRTTTQFSTRLYQLYDVELGFPRLFRDNAFLHLHATHRNYPQMQYYGPGPDSAKTGRSNYRLEDTNFSLAGGWQPGRYFRVGTTAGFTQVNVGPGTDPRFISTEQTYSPAQAPGIRQQTDFLQGGVFAQFDNRDNPAGPRSGGNYVSRFTYNRDVDLHRHTFRRLELEVQQYIPLFNARRVIAFRGRSDMTYRNGNQVVPFYMQPTLGGSNDLRGFRPFRFHDDNLMVFNLEYRYEVFSGLDMAIFGDAGKVFHEKRDFNLRNLEASYGVGMRFNARNAVFMRIDAGFSHEGFQVWLKFNNVF